VTGVRRSLGGRKDNGQGKKPSYKSRKMHLKQEGKVNEGEKDRMN
jgi:hypothetical protein